MSVRTNPPGKRNSNISLLSAGIGFVILGILLTVMPEKFTTTRMTGTGLVRVIGVASAVFFGVCTFFIARQLLKNGGTDSINDR